MTRRNNMAYDMTAPIRESIDKMYREELSCKIIAGKKKKANKN